MGASFDTGLGAFANGGTNSPTVSMSCGAAVSAGELVVVAVDSGTATVASVTDSRGNTYSAAGSSNGPGGVISLYASKITSPLSVGDTITATTSFSQTNHNICAASFLLTANAPYGSAAYAGSGLGGARTVSVTTAASAQAGDLVIGVRGGFGIGTAVPDAPFTTAQDGAGVSHSLIAYAVASSAGAVTFSVDASNSDPGLIVVAFPAAPANTAAPVVSGTNQVGQTLSTTNGSWTGSPTGYAYQWQRGGVNIAGATGSTYTLVSADAGAAVRCSVTATNAGGSASAISNALTVAPYNTAAPVVSGTSQVGRTLSTTNGSWAGAVSFAYQWQRNGVNIGGATSSTYLLASADANNSVRCNVTATNPGGSASVSSNALAVASQGLSMLI